MNEFSDIFIQLKPPASGMRCLRKTLEVRHRRTNLHGWRFAVGAIAASVLTVAWLLPGMATGHRQMEQLSDAMREAVAPLDRGLHVVNGAAFELPSSQSNVRIFLVQSTPVSAP